MPTKIFFLKRIWTKLLRLRYAGNPFAARRKWLLVFACSVPYFILYFGSNAPLLMYSQHEIISHFFTILKETGQCYTKRSLIRAKKANPGTLVITRTSDGQAYENTANPGDWLIENQTAVSEHYLMKEATFSKKYSLHQALGEGWGAYSALGQVYAKQLTPQEIKDFSGAQNIDFEGPQYKTINLQLGDYMVIPTDKSEVYRITEKEFLQTYEPVKG